MKNYLKNKWSMGAFCVLSVVFSYSCNGASSSNLEVSSSGWAPYKEFEQDVIENHLKIIERAKLGRRNDLEERYTQGKRLVLAGFVSFEVGCLSIAMRNCMADLPMGFSDPMGNPFDSLCFLAVSAGGGCMGYGACKVNEVIQALLDKKKT